MMRIVFLLMIGMVCGAACLPQTIAPAPDFQTIRAEYRGWHALQDEPENVSMMIFTLCRLPTEEEMAFAESDEHGGFFLRDFINDPGFEALTNGSAVFPAGSVIVKEKFRDSSETWEHPEALGVMIKRDAGFNPASNDWEFLYWDESGILWQGIEATASCQACHAEAERDFVFETR